jgi:DNA-binding CsgD family transcriptional regulator
MRRGKPARQVFEHIQALAGLACGPQIALTEAALALGGALAARSSVVAIGRADLALRWSFSDAPGFDEHVWPYFERLGRIDKIRRAAAQALDLAAQMPVLSTADFPVLTRRTTIYRELMVPSGVEHILRLLVPAADETVYSFAFGRARRERPFAGPDKALALEALPLLRACAESGAGAGPAEAFSEEAFLLFGPPGLPAQGTPLASQWLRLAGGGAADGHAAGMALAAAAASAAAEDPAGTALRQAANGFGTFELRAQRLGGGATGATTRTVVALRRAIPADAFALRNCARLQLPLRQMELAARLARRATVEQAAAELGLRPVTARNYARLIYARLGVTSREELGRVLAPR